MEKNVFLLNFFLSPRVSHSPNLHILLHIGVCQHAFKLSYTTTSSQTQNLALWYGLAKTCGILHLKSMLWTQICNTWCKGLLDMF